MNTRFSARSVFLSALIFLMLLFSFQFNSFHAATDFFFKNHQRDSEALVLGRIIETTENGYASQGGFMGRYDANAWDAFQYEAYFNDNHPTSNFVLYMQSAGLQGYVYSATDALFRFIGIESGEKRLKINKFITSSLMALTLTIFFWFIEKNFGLYSAFISIILFSTSQWLVVFSNNLYWMFFLILMPFVIVSHCLQRNSESRIRFIHLYALVYGAILLKCLAGYEYISTILLSILVPLLFFSIRDSWRFKDFFARSFMVGLSGLLGFLSAIFVHILLLTSHLGSWSNAVSVIWGTIARRTHGNPADYDDMLRASLESNVFDVLLKYWNGKAFDFQALFGFSGYVTFGFIIIMLAVLTCVGLALTQQVQAVRSFRRIHLASTLSVWFSIFAPLSWHVLAKGHSYIHTHMNHVLWYVPFLLLGFPYALFVIRLILASLEDCSKERKTLVAGVFSACIFGILFFSVNSIINEKNSYIQSLKELSPLESPNLRLYQGGNDLVYIASVCDKSLDTRFFLHLYPVDAGFLSGPSIPLGFANFDFSWKDKMVQQVYKTIFDIFRTHGCLSRIKMSYYPITGIRTGQFNDAGRLWQNFIDLSQTRFAHQFTAFNLTDERWVNGVSRDQSALFIKNTFENRQSLKEGDKISFKNSGERVIKKINYSELYVNITVSDPPLSPELDGYPNTFSLIETN